MTTATAPARPDTARTARTVAGGAAAATLEEVAHEVRQGRWAKHTFYDGASACIVGWLWDRFHLDLAARQQLVLLPLLVGDRLEELRTSVAAIASEIGCPETAPLEEQLGLLIAFNDDPTTTAEDVALVVKRAAANLASPGLGELEAEA